VGDHKAPASDEGLLPSYFACGKSGVLVEINCETDFVARNEGFARLPMNRQKSRRTRT